MYEKRTANIKILILHLITWCTLWSEKYGTRICASKIGPGCYRLVCVVAFFMKWCSGKLCLVVVHS